MTSYYPTVSGDAKPKSLEWMVIGMGFTMGVQQYFTMEEIHEGWIRNCVKGDEAAGSGRRKSPVGSRGKAPVGSLGTVPQKPGADPRICERGPVPPVPFFSPYSLHFSSHSLPAPLEVWPLKPITGSGERCNLHPVGSGGKTNLVHSKAIRKPLLAIIFEYSE